MAAFKYYIIDQAGRKCKGKIEAENAKHARQILREQGLLLLKIKKVNYSDYFYKNIFIYKINYADLALMTRQLAILIMASLPLEESLRAISKQSEKKTISTLLDKLRIKIIEGYSFSSAITLYPQIFNTTYQAMVTAGEASGHLGIVLNRLADHIEQSQNIQNKVIQTLLYPCILIIVSLAIIVILLSAVIPKIVEQFINMKQTLPIATRILMTISETICDYGLIIFIVIILGILFFYKLLQQPFWHMRWHYYYLRIPVLGRLSLNLNTARYARTLCILNSSGVPFLQAMYISASVLSNIYARDKLLKATESVREGNSLSIVLESSCLFPPMINHMISLGERSGELNNMLERIADIQDGNFNRHISIAMSLLEPLLVIMMASVVLFIVLSILQPIIELNNLMA